MVAQYRIEISTKESLKQDLTLKESKNFSEGLSLQPVRVYSINCENLNEKEIKKIERFLADPITDEVSTNKPLRSKIPANCWVIEVYPKPAVTDPEGKETQRALETVLGKKINGVSFSKQYLWNGELGQQKWLRLQKELGNRLINDFKIIGAEEWDAERGMGFSFPTIDLPEVRANEEIEIEVNDEELMRISEKRLLSLRLDEMRKIRKLFQDKDYIAQRKKLGLTEKPTDAEIECIAQTWSEHCIHKKFNGIWEYCSEDPEDESGLPRVTESIFNSIIKKPAEELSKKVDWLVSLFKDNAGVIKLNERWNAAHKVETHNFPSALDPFGGANTGTGGVLRDPKCTGKGMKVISSQYGFRVPHPLSYQDLPEEIIPPKKILQGVVAGVEDYGNKMGIPTRCGQVLIDDSWLKCAVYVGAVAVVPAEINGRKTHLKEIKEGYIAVSLGGDVGKDGIHGATASSIEQQADAEKDIQINQAVQIGDPITQKKMFDVMDILAEEDLIEAAQDCGAGGWNSAVGELAELSNGVIMNLTNAPEKYHGLKGWEKLVSEAQERAVIVIKPENKERVVEICKHLEVKATIIAVFNHSGYYQVLDRNETIVYLPLNFLDQGLPKMTITAIWSPGKNNEPEIKSMETEEEMTDFFLKMISRPNLQSYEWIATRYDQEVQGGTIIKPLVGKGRGKSDAIAYYPILGEKEVIIESWGSNPWQGEIDAYQMGKNNVIDALGKIIAAGGNLNKIVFNGNTVCPNPEKDSEIAAKVIRMLKGAADAQTYFGTPTISGKDSTSMERSYRSTQTGEEIKVKAKTELLMSALAVIPDSSTLTTGDLKIPGDLIFMAGETQNELGASEFYLLYKEIGNNVPKANMEKIKKRFEQLAKAIAEGLIHSAQYITKGGMAAALANAAIAGDRGIDVRLDPIKIKLDKLNECAETLLYSETVGRFIVTVHPINKEKFMKMMEGSEAVEIGKVSADRNFKIKYKQKIIISTEVSKLREKNKGEIKF